MVVARLVVLCLAAHLALATPVAHLSNVGVLSNMRKFFNDLRTNLDTEEEATVASSSGEALKLPPRSGSGPAASAEDTAAASAAAAAVPLTSSRLSTAALLSAFLPQLEGPARHQEFLPEDMNAEELLELLNRQAASRNYLSPHSQGWTPPAPRLRFGNSHGQPYAHSGLGK